MLGTQIGQSVVFKTPRSYSKYFINIGGTIAIGILHLVRAVPYVVRYLNLGTSVRRVQVGLAVNRIFEVLGEIKNISNFIIPWVRPPRARADHATWPASLKRHRMALLGHFEPGCLLGYQDLAHAVCD